MQALSLLLAAANFQKAQKAADDIEPAPAAILPLDKKIPGTIGCDREVLVVYVRTYTCKRCRPVAKRVVKGIMKRTGLGSPDLPEA